MDTIKKTNRDTFKVVYTRVLTKIIVSVFKAIRASLDRTIRRCSMFRFPLVKYLELI